ncbi:MAG: YybS family protein [Alicyclobacillus herbarius]|uniref:DUF2232 domain-containing protein n=1 Tax=Alicyclobacillus herbarius TaxID=122960 RepID=UPI0023555550|nr:DUF2232 domain-containing protein [Alicyclobacillus herbarius]MCL6631760.1 YybS family protein [Alicyclobacillus herbarius]
MNRRATAAREHVWAGGWFVGLIALTLSPLGPTAGVWLFPVPLAIIYCLNSLGPVLGLAAIAGTALFVAGTGWLAVLFSVWMTAVAVILGDALSRRESPYFAWIGATLCGTMLELGILAASGGGAEGFYDTWREEWTRWLVNAGPGTGLSRGEGAALIAHTIAWLQVMLPGVLILAAFLVTALNWSVCRYVLRRLHPPVGMLSGWKLPRSVVNLYLAALAFLLLGISGSTTLLGQLAHNVVFLSGFFLGVQGLICLWKGVSGRRWRALWLGLLVLLASVRLISDFYVLVGIFDVLRTPRSPSV